MKTYYTLCVAFALALRMAMAQTPAIRRVDPTNWWVGMKSQNLQLLVYGPNAGTLTYTISYPGVRLVKTSKVTNPNYAFLDLTIAPTTKAGTLQLVGKGGGKTLTRGYELKSRTNGLRAQGVTSADFIYLLMPDRFSNGDESNDKFADMADPQADRANPFLRHGGDMQGVINHLDYLKELGATALWMTPIIENDQPQTNEGGAMRSAYHGYGFTDHYRVDRRFGGNAAYKKLIDAAHTRGLRVVQDAVYNHIGINHWFFKDLPMADWVHQWPTYTNTTYRYQAVPDPHGSASDRRVLVDGWFVPFLPDLNQNNPFVANYLIQHALWTVEEFGIDAWRIDTYLYNDQAFMNRCNAALLAQYPRIHIFGESSVNNVVDQAYYVRNRIGFPFASNLPGGLDFVLYNALNQGLNEATTNTDNGVNHVQQVLAQDAVYADPTKMVTFLENHDLDRFYSVIGEDLAKYKMGVTWLLTTRGIPHWYYGTEILMKNFKNPSDAEVRRDFPGGFPGDKEDKFDAGGRSKAENEAFDFVKKLANYRKATPALHSGQFMQFLPQDGTYVYFRYNADKTILIATNTTDKDIQLDSARFSERMAGFTKARNVMTGDVLTGLALIRLPAKTALVLELGK